MRLQGSVFHQIEKRLKRPQPDLVGASGVMVVVMRRGSACQAACAGAGGLRVFQGRSHGYDGARATGGRVAFVDLETVDRAFPDLHQRGVFQRADFDGPLVIGHEVAHPKTGGGAHQKVSVGVCGRVGELDRRGTEGLVFFRELSQEPLPNVVYCMHADNASV